MTQTLLIPVDAVFATVASVSLIGVASDGSGMTTFLYFEPLPEITTTFIGLDLFWFETFAKAD